MSASLSTCGFRIGHVVTVCDRAGRRRHDAIIAEIKEERGRGLFAVVIALHKATFDIAPYPWPLVELQVCTVNGVQRLATAAEIEKLRTIALATDTVLLQYLDAIEQQIATTTAA